MTDPAAIIPHNAQYEEAVLGAVIIRPEVFDDLSFLSPQKFYIHRNRWVWEALVLCHEQDIPIDVMTVSNQLEKTGHLSECGGSAYLIFLSGQVPSTYNAEAYARELHSLYIKRLLIPYANEVATQAYNGVSGEEALSAAHMGLSNIEQGNGIFSGVALADELSRLYDSVDQKKPVLKFIPTGLSRLDQLLWGWHQTKLYTVAGRPGQGKTSFLLGTARTAALLHSQRVGYFSMEMTEHEMTASLMAQEAEIDSRRIEKGELADDEWPKFTYAIEKLSNSKIDLHYVPALTIPQLRSRCVAGKYDLVIVDYLQLMVSEKRTENRTQEVSYLTRSLKVMAGQLKVPVIMAAQLSRTVESRSDRRPMLSDLRDSGSIEADSDVVIYIYGMDEDDPTKTERKIEVAKQRSGPTGVQSVKFQGKFTKFSD